VRRRPTNLSPLVAQRATKVNRLPFVTLWVTKGYGFAALLAVFVAALAVVPGAHASSPAAWAASSVTGGGSPSVLAPPEPAPPRPKLHRCDLGMPRPFRCGHIIVPVRRGHPGLGTTKVAFAIRHRRDTAQPSLGTIFAMDGGPGYASTAKPYASSLIAALGPILRRRDLVLYDMRGTGLSDAIDCPALQAGLIQESIAIGECANQLGPSFAGYNSGEAAEDMNQVRRALGLGKIFFYGDSYGTFFGQAYAVRHPGTLRGLILDSAYPGNDPYYRTLLPAGLTGLRIACRDSATCSGDPVARLRRVVGRFHRSSRPTDPLISFLLEAGTLAPRSYLSLDEGDRRFLAGEPRRLDGLLAPELGGEKLTEFSNGLAIAVECNDYRALWNKGAPLPQRLGELAANVRKLPRRFTAPFGRREFILSPATRLTPCLYWPAPPAGGLPPAIPSDWTAPSSFPTLVTSGQVDDVTSVREAHEVAARFPRSRLYVVPDRGHVSSLYFPFRSREVGVIRKFIAAH
jgi:pimeloyl-ACP methyl ester carboxylesterase